MTTIFSALSVLKVIFEVYTRSKMTREHLGSQVLVLFSVLFSFCFITRAPQGSLGLPECPQGSLGLPGESFSFLVWFLDFDAPGDPKGPQGSRGFPQGFAFDFLDFLALGLPRAPQSSLGLPQEFAFDFSKFSAPGLARAPLGFSRNYRWIFLDFLASPGFPEDPQGSPGVLHELVRSLFNVFEFFCPRGFQGPPGLPRAHRGPARPCGSWHPLPFSLGPWHPLSLSALVLWLACVSSIFVSVLLLLFSILVSVLILLSYSVILVSSISVSVFVPACACVYTFECV